MMFRKKKNVIVVGADSMLGHDLVEELRWLSCQQDSYIGVVLPLSHAQCDICGTSLFEWLRRDVPKPPVKFDYVVNCAAVTDTKKIEEDPEFRKKAYAVNAVGARNVAWCCMRTRTKLIHISTDWVYSEHSVPGMLTGCNQYRCKPQYAYSANGSACEFPKSAYGMQKLVGEQFIKELLGKRDYAILRTSWLYGGWKHKSFVHKVLKGFMLARRSTSNPAEPFFEMTSNEYSVPTSTFELVKMVVNTIKYGLHGTFAACGQTSATGCNYAVSRLEFAKAILKDATDYISSSILEFIDAENMLKAIERDTYAPKYSRMLNLPKIEGYSKLYEGLDPFLHDWQAMLNKFFYENQNRLGQWLLEEKAAS